MKKLHFTFLFPLFVLKSFFSFSGTYAFATQHQFTHPPINSSTQPLRKMPVFQGVASWHKNLTLSYFILLWDFGIHPYYSLNACVLLCYLWSYYPLSKIFYSVCGLSIVKGRRFEEEFSLRLW